MELAILSLAIIAHLGIGIFTYFYNPKSATHRFFLLFSVFSVAWGTANYLSLHQVTPEHTLRAIRLVMFFACFHALSLFLLIQTFPSTKLQINRLLLTLIVITTLIVAALTQTSLIFSSVKGVGLEASPIPGPGIALFAFVTGLLILNSIILLIARYRKSKGILKAQYQYLIIGVVGSASLIFITNFLMVVVFHITSLLILGSTYTLIFIGSTAYAMVAHQLFDIRVIIKRTVVYSGLLLFTLAIYSMVIFFFTTIFGGENVFDYKSFIANLIAALFIAIGFEPIRLYLNKITDKYLFKGEYDPQAVLAELSRSLSDSIDIRQATQSLVTIVKSQLRLSHAAVVTFTNQNNNLVIKDVTQDGYEDPSVLQLPLDSQLIKNFVSTPQLIIADVIRKWVEMNRTKTQTQVGYKDLLQELNQLQADLIFPIQIQRKAIGMFIVGEKLSGDIFTKEEIAFLGIIANQTANALEKARFWEEDQMKSEFVSVASHELLTPTAAMKGYLSMVLDDHMGQVDDTARGFLVKVAESTERLADLVNELLNVSRIEGGRLKINKKPFSLVDSTQKAVDELHVAASKKQLDLAFIAPIDPLPNASADPDHVYRVLINLIGNAVKYTRQGWVRCFVTRYDPHHLLFTVMDSGLGIPVEHIPHLFEKFYRADRKEIAGIQGTGLGLFISKKIIDLSGGQMWVHSQPGQGTIFYFTLPLADQVMAQAIPTRLTEHPQSADVEKSSVVI